MSQVGKRLRRAPLAPLRRNRYRFEERQFFGYSLERHGLGKLDTNLGEADLDFYLWLELTPKGERLKARIQSSVSSDQWARVAQRGWYSKENRAA